jgi:hypothetical protein
MRIGHTHPVHCVAVVRTSTGKIPPGGVIRFTRNGTANGSGPSNLGPSGDKFAPVFQPVHNGAHMVTAFYSGTKQGSVIYLASRGAADVQVGLLVCLVPNGKISTGWWLATGLPWWLFLAVLFLIVFGFLLRKRYLEEHVEKDAVTADFDPDDDTKEFS